MFQKLLDAIERLKNAAEGDKKKPGLYLGGLIGGAIGAGLNLDAPEYTYEVMDEFGDSQWNAYAGLAESAVVEAQSQQTPPPAA